jgi:SNF2 family DNA or RNA helicase
MIAFQDNSFEIPGAWSFRAKGAPDRVYKPGKKIWVLPNTAANRRFLTGCFLPTDFKPDALTAARTEPPPPAPAQPFPITPEGILPHQLEGLSLSYSKTEFAFFHEMGSGKSRTLLELWQQWYEEGKIDEAWVICPNSIIGNWHDQIKLWVPAMKDVIKVYGVLSLSAGKLPGELVQASHSRLAIAVDESQRIKNSTAKRSRVMYEIGKHAYSRAILTGTPLTKGVEDLYSQYYFLDPKITGFRSYYAFRNRYCVMGGFEGKQIVAYQNLDELLKAVAPYTHVVREPVKLPPMAREERVVQMTPEQRRLLQELKSQMKTEMAGSKLTVANALAYYTRGAQILGGFFPMADGRLVPVPNNKLDELVEIVEGTDLKIVVFTRFVAEAKLVEAKLQRFGVLRIGSDTDNIQERVNKFQSDPAVQCFVSTYAMGSVGFTLTAARILVKYSGTFNFEEEVQSEKRIHRIGQEYETATIRIMAESKLDRAIKQIAERKQTMADFVTANLTNPTSILDAFE